MSYSLYLWHWPVFSLVDYRFFLASPWLRLGLKVVLSFAATLLCFRLIENPGRVYLNDPRRPPIAFAFLTAALLFLSLEGGKRAVIDIEPFFATREGKILYIDAGGVQFYHDVAHLSEYGMDLVKPAFLKALEPL